MFAQASRERIIEDEEEERIQTAELHIQHSSTPSVPHAHTPSSPSFQSMKLIAPTHSNYLPPSSAAECPFGDPRHPETKTVGDQEERGGELQWCPGHKTECGAGIELEEGMGLA